MLDRHAARPLLVALLIGATLVMVANGCGSSNSTTTTVTATGAGANTTAPSTSSTTSKSPGQPAQTLSLRYTDCLAQNGVKVSKVNGVPSLSGINTQTPQYTAARKKCLPMILEAERAQKATGTAPTKGKAISPVLSRYIACLRQNGVHVPSSGASGTLSLRGIDTASAQYRQAAVRCRKVILGAQGAAASSPKAPTGAATGRLHSLLVNYIACLRQNGISVPSSDTNGVGSLKGVNINTPQFKAARTKCESVILSALKVKRAGSTSSGH